MKLKPRNNVFASQFLTGATFTGKYEFPTVAPVRIDQLSAIPYDRINRNLRAKSPLWIHHYVFDTRFQPMLKSPDDSYPQFQMYAGVIGLDNSLYRDLPLVEQIQSVFLNRLYDFRWQRLGILVIPNVVWGDERSFEFCFDGLPQHSTIAVSSVSMLRKEEPENLFYFINGFHHALEALEPHSIAFHGTIPDEAAYLACQHKVPLIPIPYWRQLVFDFDREVTK